QGQNQANTTIKLANNASGFGDGSCDASYESGSGCPAMLYSSTATRDGGWPNGAGEGGYWNDIFDLTLDTGSGNAGAVAIDWNCSNTAAIRNVTIKGSGRVGLNTSRGAGGGGNGPALVKNLTVNGSFDYGIVAGSGEVGLTFEHIFITNPKTAGFWNTNQNIWIRDLEVTASGNVPAILNQNNSNLSVIDSSFTGSGTSAIQNSAWLYARNIQTSGYASAIAGVTGTSVNEYSSTSVVKLTSAASGNSLRLPIKETPAPFTDNNFSNWAIVQNTGGDSTAAIQSALNSGKATVYFPPVATYNITGTLHIPSGVRRLLGAVSAFNAPNGAAIIECDSTSGGPVEIRSFSFAGSINIVNKCGVPLVIADVFNLNGYSNVAGSGLEVYFENAAIPGDGVIQHGGNAWARQLDVETNNTHGTTDGGNFWVLGFKTEGTGENGNGMWYTTNQGSTEIIGAFDSTPGAGNWTGYQTIDSSISISGLSAGSGLTTPLMEKHNGAVSTYSNNGVRFGGTAVPLYSGK
ncbi:MAG TPA: hypothetical protein VHB50_23180, partial [Bryobacteraceae bacterium]|nr:hypothetical protein [Bryobacteraceae bacterium]